MENIDIEKIIECLSLYPINKAWLFGSRAEGTQRPDSDIDLLVSFKPEAKIGLLTLSRISRELEEISQKSVDLVVDGSLYPWVKENVEKQKILIYERRD